MHSTAIKYLLSFLLIIVLFSCNGRAVGGLGNKLKQCCASLSPDKKPVSLSHFDEGTSSETPVSLFEIETKLIHTW